MAFWSFNFGGQGGFAQEFWHIDPKFVRIKEKKGTFLCGLSNLFCIVWLSTHKHFFVWFSFSIWSLLPTGDFGVTEVPVKGDLCLYIYVFGPQSSFFLGLIFDHRKSYCILRSFGYLTTFWHSMMFRCWGCLIYWNSKN